jgi:CheY-like chemotaxis protein/HPt (histidine-containing phosphotransfer) domain-containing protein
MVRGEMLDLAPTVVVDGRTHRWQFAGQRVLVVDDGDENRELVRLVLEEVGIKVDEAANGQIAVDKVRAYSYDLVLMDMQMPVLDGYKATQQLRAMGYTQPVIALTAHAMAGFETKVLAAGCTGYLTKPIDIDFLLRHLATLLDARQVAAEAPKAILGGAPMNEAEATKSQDLGPVTSRLAGHPKLGAVARTFGLKLPVEVLKMQNALVVRDFAQLAELAHWLKGAAGSVGYDLFTEPAQRLEKAAKTQDLQLASESLIAVGSLATRLELPPAASSAPVMQDVVAA